MKIRIEVDETTLENEVVIRCAGLTKEVQMIQQALSEIAEIGRASCRERV